MKNTINTIKEYLINHDLLNKRIIKIALITAFLLMLSVRVDAITVENLPDAKVYNDFAVGPGKIEMELEPGQTGTFDLMVSNRLGTDKSFSLDIEDFKGTDDPNKTVELLGNDKGPYSLRDFVKVEKKTVDIEHGKRVRIPVSVSIPKNAEPGGLYGSVVVGTLSKNNDTKSESGVTATNPIFTRVGVLIFIKIKGEVEQNGKLVDFKLQGNKKIISGLNDVGFTILFKNDGNIHLNPKGEIIIKNTIGSVVGKIDVESWFAMPKSLRMREVSWSPKFLMGRYTALASVDRGYGELKDQSEYTFYAFPWQIIVAIFILAFVVIVLFKKISRK